MTASVNIQAHPTPQVWDGGVSIPPSLATILDEASSVIQDETGAQINQDP